ncbi:hypothetical protein [Aureibacter tunicatorum]|uniref:Uncharacterized protein n=1 Tax=Aureibacter tunicatorum TaxID=866807 RepID=A0AAE3XP60_9BACT|nr:hypothetical protein [Aureibacter tunicatorum]MDR6239558.1 hypothetical protein [Aureibacter tunicatorum]BDD04035.1 hypothetical protein AUTU_15180 [Aureibacter tunicatorum]
MDIEKLNADLTEIALLKNKLNDMDYNNPKYDDVEEELHDLEDDFMEEFGDALEDILTDIHEELCPDNEVLLPIAYLANQYEVLDKDEDGKTLFDAKFNEGVIVDVDSIDDQISRLVLVPGPARILLQAGKKIKKELWVG